jgi:hypothetical protein
MYRMELIELFYAQGQPGALGIRGYAGPQVTLAQSSYSSGPSLLCLCLHRHYARFVRGRPVLTGRSGSQVSAARR